MAALLVSVVYILFNAFCFLFPNLFELKIKEGSEVASWLNLNLTLCLPSVSFSYVQNKCVSES